MRTPLNALALTLLLASAPALAGEVTLKAQAGGETIGGLTWAENAFELKIRRSGWKYHPFARVQGRYPVANSHLLVQIQEPGAALNPIATETDGTFALEAPVNETTGEAAFTLTAVDALGQVQQVSYKAVVTGWEAAKKREAARFTHRLFVNPLLGVGVLTYAQTYYAGFTELSLVPRVQASYDWIPGKLSTAADFFFTIPNVGLGGSSTVEMLSFDAVARYTPPWLQEPWGLRLALGGYYYDTFASSTFGFKDLAGPELIVTGVWTPSHRKMVSLALRYGPVMRNLSILDPSNYVFGFEARYAQTLGNGHPLFGALRGDLIGLDYTMTQVSTNLFTISIGYGF